MKTIRIEKTIISLENVRNIKLTQQGTGSKANPYYSIITVEYHGDNEESSIWFLDDWAQTTGEKYMEKIMSILSEG